MRSASEGFFTDTRAKAKTLRTAQRLEDEHRQVRLGYRPALQSADIHWHCPFAEVKDEYLAWGESQGGRSARPWSETHARNRCAHLGWWHTRLGLESMVDSEDILPRAQEALRQLQALGRSGKTLANYAEALAAFCDWFVQHGYLAQGPLKSLKTFDTTSPDTTSCDDTGRNFSIIAILCISWEIATRNGIPIGAPR